MVFARTQYMSYAIYVRYLHIRKLTEKEQLIHTQAVEPFIVYYINNQCIIGMGQFSGRMLYMLKMGQSRVVVR